MGLAIVTAIRRRGNGWCLRYRTTNYSRKNHALYAKSREKTAEVLQLSLRYGLFKLALRPLNLSLLTDLIEITN